jgi:acyl carrier protein
MAHEETLAGITEVLAAVASVDSSQVTPEKTLAELGLDSMATLEVIVAVEDRFGLIIPDDEWARFRTLGDIVRHVEQAAIPLASPS